MNETVKQALLWESMGARNTIENCDQDIVALRRRLAHAETRRAEQVARLSDIELHLRDNGVDLAVVDAEAEKANPFKVDGLRTLDAFDPTAGLAKALDEA